MPEQSVLDQRREARHTWSLRRPVFGLALVAVLSVFVHGYHLGVDDAEIYLPAIKKMADPALFPFGAEFFMSHAGVSFFPDLVGNAARLTRLPPDLVIFLFHAAGIVLLLLASWRLACCCFESGRARWAGVGVLAGVLSVPVAGTALFVADPYVTARTLSTPMTIFAIACFLSYERVRAVLWLLAIGLVHAQMAVYTAVFLACLALARNFETRPEGRMGMALPVVLPFLFEFQPARGPAREALLSRTYFFVSNWTWYEWVGVCAPLALLWWSSSAAPRNTTAAFRRLARTLVPFGLVFTAAALVLTFPERLENYTRLQPMRAFHLIYVIFFVLLGGLAGEYVLKARTWRWLCLFLPLAAGMWFMARESYPASDHVEWPGMREQRNPWVSAFLWIRENTPKDAVFALDPDYMARADQHGFRAIAERSALADALKDSGAVSLFPHLAERWKSQVLAQTGWDRFTAGDFERLSKAYPVTWVLTRRPAPASLACPYENSELVVCRIGQSP